MCNQCRRNDSMSYLLISFYYIFFYDFCCQKKQHKLRVNDKRDWRRPLLKPKSVVLVLWMSSNLQ